MILDVEDIIKRYVDQIEKEYPAVDNKGQTAYKDSLIKIAGISLENLSNQRVERILETYLYAWGNMGRLLGQDGFNGWQSKITKEIQNNHKMLESFRHEQLETVNLSESEADIKKCYESFKEIVGRIGAAKLLHLICSDLFPIWDNAIADGVRRELVLKELAAGKKWTIEAFSPDDYFKFMEWMQQFIMEHTKVLSELADKHCKSKIRIVDECLLFAVRRPCYIIFDE